jgi:uncharacterized protein (TIGR03790 family)
MKYLVILLAMLVSADAMAVSAQQLAVVYNRLDPDSREIATYYQQQRSIPQQNMIAVEMTPGKAQINREQFESVYRQVVDATPATVQFYALAWSTPYRVGCMSVTSAFTFGFDQKYCARGCASTATSPYYNSDSDMPYDDFKIRPSMLLAGSTTDQVRAMIDRGIRAADYDAEKGTAYLVSTTDRARNVRASIYPAVVARLGNRLPIQIVKTDALENKHDVMFYFTGLKSVDKIDTNVFLAGAIADHLTSSGGNLFGGSQMSALRWLDAGATASYGSVVEPCAFVQKFPDPGIVIDRYTRGESLIAAYWKSVLWPGQGLFVGEPLAAPYAHAKS